MTLFIYFFLPETKGIPIDDMGAIWSKHWYWKKYVTIEKNDDTKKSTENNSQSQVDVVEKQV